MNTHFIWSFSVSMWFKCSKPALNVDSSCHQKTNKKQISHKNVLKQQKTRHKKLFFFYIPSDRYHDRLAESVSRLKKSFGSNLFLLRITGSIHTIILLIWWHRDSENLFISKPHKCNIVLVVTFQKLSRLNLRANLLDSVSYWALHHLKHFSDRSLLTIRMTELSTD